MKENTCPRDNPFVSYSTFPFKNQPLPLRCHLDVTITSPNYDYLILASASCPTLDHYQPALHIAQYLYRSMHGLLRNRWVMHTLWRAATARNVATRLQALQRFSTTPLAWKKKTPKPESVGSSQNSSEAHEFDAKGLESDFQKSLSLFEAKAKEVKLGNANLEAYNNVQVKIKDDVVPLNSLANVQNRGNRKVIVTVFDPKDVKHIQTAILETFSLPAQTDPSNNQTLFVNLIGGQGAEAKQGMVKNLKKEYEHIRNSPSKASFTAIRAKYLTPLKKELKSKELDSDSFRKYSKLIEGKFKEYSDKLAQDLRTYEEQILKGE